MMNKIILSLFFIINYNWFMLVKLICQKYILIVPEDNLLSECVVVQPPSLESFMKTDSVGQLMLMTEAFTHKLKI